MTERAKDSDIFTKKYFCIDVDMRNQYIKTNPEDEDIYYVYSDKCVECVGHHDEPACATACPTEGCITWDQIGGSTEHRDDVTQDQRDNLESVVE
jgi:ferredoxin